jgi:calnexin
MYLVSLCLAVLLGTNINATTTAAPHHRQKQPQQSQQSQQQSQSQIQGVFFRETFDEIQDVFRSKWAKSSDPKYTDQPVMIKHADRPPRGFERDKGLSLTQEMKFYGVSSTFPTPLHNADGGDIVLQYELKLEETLMCGGAYIKMPRVDGGGDLKSMNSDTPYSLMFGPDKYVHVCIRVY